MSSLIGMIMVLVCVLVSYTFMGGHLAVLVQPFEAVIIFGSGVSAFLVGNPPKVFKAALGRLAGFIKGPHYKKQDYLELLLVQYQIFRLMKQKGALAVETHIEAPEESSIFTEFPNFLKNHHGVDFFCDYIRLITMGNDNPMELESLMEQEIDVHHTEEHAISHSLAALGESFPALGIVAAVLGVIHTMGAISEPPEILGHLIGGALVGTFLGILLSYGWFSPLANLIGQMIAEESTYLVCLKAGIIAHLKGYAPQVSVEYARKALVSHMRPSFSELEQEFDNLPSVG